MRSRFVLLGVAAAFLLPFLLAWWLNFGPWPWRPEAARNRGTLIQPPVAVGNAGVHNLVASPGQGAPAAEPFRGRWSLVYAGDGSCNDGCEGALINMRQSWLALGQDARRVQRWFLVVDGMRPSASLLDSHPGLAVITPDSSEATASGTLGGALRAARETLGDGPAQAGRGSDDVIWLVDPGGFVILAYGSAATATDLLRDMQRLLKYSAQDR